MKFIIVGLGKVGRNILRCLTDEEREVTVLDTNEDKVREAVEKYDVNGFCANGCIAEDLKEAGAATAGLIVAVTASDEQNVLCCMIAKSLGVKYAVARVRDPEYNKQIDFMREHLGVDRLVNPERALAEEVARVIRFPAAEKVYTFGEGKAEIVEMTLPEGCALCGKKLSEVVSRDKRYSVLLAAISRDGETFVPNGNTQLREKDVVNICGNAVLIFHFKMGVMGAALASLVSRMIACFAVIYLLEKPGCLLRIEHLTDLKPDLPLIRRILRVGIPAGIENGMFQIGKLSVSSLTSTLGTSAIAANAVAGNITTFLNVPANAVGMAVLTVIGQCLGAGEKEQAKHYARRFLLVAYAGAWIMNLSAFFFLNRITLSWFNLSPESNAMALQVMVWFNIISLFIWPSSFTMPNILSAAGDATFTMTVSVFSMWVFRVGFCYLMVLGLHQGNLLSIWGGMFLDWLFRSLFFAIRFFKGSWLEKKVI